MKIVEIYVLLGTGYVCGLAVASGFIMRCLMQLFVNGKSAWRSFVWVIWMAINTLTVVMIPMFLIGILAVGDMPGRTDFWVRFSLFAGGAVVGLSFVLGSMLFINKKVKIIRT